MPENVTNLWENLMYRTTRPCVRNLYYFMKETRLVSTSYKLNKQAQQKNTVLAAAF